MKKILFVLGALALLAEPVSAMPIRVSHDDAVVGVQPTKTVTAAGVAHRSTRRTARRVNRRHGY
ncbi:hypothetical protein [Rhodoblastus sp.]|uniref:hypothetical protein n=1 Tax=Rhodoblastus sp. TaxID=1962975 RepID=UPI0035B1EEFE